MTVDNCGALQSYRQQLDVLEADPNATASYRQGLEQQFAAMKAEMDASTGGPQCKARTASSGCGDPSGADRPANFVRERAASTGMGQAIGGGGGSLSGNLPPALQQLKPYIDAASRATGISPQVLAAQIWQESGGNIGARSINPGNGKSDTGLMQINPDTYAQLQQDHPELRGKSLSDPANNILAGAYLMQDLTKQFGSTDLALRAYNSGTGSVDPANANITTTGLGDPDYVRSVDSFILKLQDGQSF
jgi:soluble lytic murein transglycosylase-like protein